jgi:hypothetical protein
MKTDEVLRREDSNLKDAMLKDLELQWKDHHHMRDQAFKALTNSVLVFLGVVGLEIKDVGNIVMIPSYCVLIFIALIGLIVAAHLRIRQGQKFLFIGIYEKELGLFQFKEESIKKEQGILGPFKIFTTRLIETLQGGLMVIAFFLLINRIVFT